MFTLAALDPSQPIDKLIIRAIEGGAYLAFIEVDGEEHLIVDKKGAPLKSFNKIDLQKAFSAFTLGATVLQHESAYDEMIGQPMRQSSNRLEVPLGPPN